jgi:GxxExxY protein
VLLTGGLLPFPRTGCALDANAILSHGAGMRQGRSTGSWSRVADSRGCTRITCPVTNRGFSRMHADYLPGHESRILADARGSPARSRVADSRGCTRIVFIDAEMPESVTGARRWHCRSCDIRREDPLHFIRTRLEIQARAQCSQVARRLRHPAGMAHEHVNLLHRDLTDKVLGVFYDTYNELGCGFPEYVYSAALAIALAGAGLTVASEVQLPVHFRGLQIARFRIDILVNDVVLIEVKAAQRIEPWHIAQVRNYLKASGVSVGMLLNFGPQPTFKRSVFDTARGTLVTESSYVPDPRASSERNRRTSPTDEDICDL